MISNDEIYKNAQSNQKIHGIYPGKSIHEIVLDLYAIHLFLSEISVSNQKSAQYKKHINTNMPFLDEFLDEIWKKRIVERKKMQHKYHPCRDCTKASKCRKEFLCALRHQLEKVLEKNFDFLFKPILNGILVIQEFKNFPGIGVCFGDFFSINGFKISSLHRIENDFAPKFAGFLLVFVL
ncbi:hypothetical protein SDC9_185129 [bioreactor metagenome]|uniref:Uncharacterized protein n=1 Tax=bioreactor metagenome TaxID=1076179 RepID=A0A645HHD4_9ZZZZ